ncbi:hypothetical protein DAEQUDRAFT_113051 [Daedalea quercina L-15889]|uniref:Uncharacterized protein n=1 Tax=Daedalea quercina L-15889 TaxID=1314783 RepID=A0A165S619_9APHY|nr:hypothetical protein DAEQUDRAFT_113051 [Daedalea quercina L-15889]
MSCEPPLGWGPPWSTGRPPPWVTGPMPPESAVAHWQPRPQGYFYNAYSGAEHEPMAIDEAELYPSGPEAEIDDPSNYEAAMEVDYPTTPNAFTGVDMSAGPSVAPAPTMSIPYGYTEAPRTPLRRSLGRAITDYFSPSRSPLRTRSQSVVSTVTIGTPRRNPTNPYTPQRTPRKPTACHPNLEPHLSDASSDPPTTPRRRKNKTGEPFHPLFAELLAHEIEVLTYRLANLQLVGTDPSIATDVCTVFDSAGVSSDAAGSELTVVSNYGHLVSELGVEGAEEFLKSVFKGSR